MNTVGQSLLAAALLLSSSWPAAAAPAKPSAKTSVTIPLSNPMVFYLAQGEPNACGAGCDEWIAAEGTITNGTAERMRAFLKRLAGNKRPIYFHSPGGVTSESLAMGRLMRERGMTARVARTLPFACETDGGDCSATKRSGRPLVARLTSSQGYCNSACVYAIVGARLREIAPEARLGIHASKTIILGVPKNVTISPQTRARFTAENVQMIRRYLIAMGIPSALLDAAEKIPHESIHLLSREEMVRFNIDTRNVAEGSWVYAEGVSNSGTIFKLIDMPEAGGSQFRKTMLRLSCLAGKFMLGYEREMGPQENSFGPMRLVAASQEFELPPPAASIASSDAKLYDVRYVLVPVGAFETAAAEDRIEIAPGAGKPTITRLSTAGLASALSSLTRHCYEDSLGGAALVPRQRP